MRLCLIFHGADLGGLLSGSEPIEAIDQQVGVHIDDFLGPINSLHGAFESTPVHAATPCGDEDGGVGGPKGFSAVQARSAGSRPLIRAPGLISSNGFTPHTFKKIVCRTAFF